MTEHEPKILTPEAMESERRRLREEGKKLVFTNGCFDIIHAGHVDYLSFARRQGDALVVGLNSDASVKRNKGEKRPVVRQEDRAKVLAALQCVDYVVVFDEDDRVAATTGFVLSPEGSDVVGVDFTGVLKRFRGRGLASALKHLSMRGARELGYARVLTQTDPENEAMVAVNRRFGFVESGGMTLVRKTLRPSPGSG